MTEVADRREEEHPPCRVLGPPFAQQALSPEVAQWLGSASLVDRIGNNDQSLRSVRLDHVLLPLNETMEALLRNNTIKSIVITRIIPTLTTEAEFSRFLECLYHLPLRSIQIEGGDRLPKSYLNHILHLVEYCCGVGDACRLQDCGDGADKEMTGDVLTEEVHDGVVHLVGKGLSTVAAPASHKKPNPTLEFVDMSQCRFTVKQARRLGAFLFHQCCTIRRLDVSGCQLGNSGVEALLEPAAGSQRLKTTSSCDDTDCIMPLDVLDLRSNGITEDAALRSFLDVVENNSECTIFVTTSGNYISRELYERFMNHTAKIKPLLKVKGKERGERNDVVSVQEREEQFLTREKPTPPPQCFFVDMLLSTAGESDACVPTLRALSKLLHESI
uniref:Uncharacterized protein TCIL3000_11_10880 n=1 Tax=Trypanosoma congolense (strain IL3000) TaxID=1068625 RepID=G0V1U0_TRYCI|nr:unnamed protein product [Trypanosoma congolense IL3000]